VNAFPIEETAMTPTTGSASTSPGPVGVRTREDLNRTGWRSVAGPLPLRELREVPRSPALPVGPILRYLSVHLRWAAPYVSRALFRLAERWRDGVIAELNRGVFRAWQERDLAALLAAFQDDCVIDMSHWPAWPDQSIYQGSHDLQRFLTAWHFVWGDLDARPVRFAALDPERYLFEIEFRGSGDGSGIDVERRFFQIAEFRGGLPARIANYTDEQEAFGRRPRSLEPREDAMSRENIEAIRGVYSILADQAAFRRGDYDDVFFDYFSRDYELIPPPSYPTRLRSTAAWKARTSGSG
jgi:ketosteroid isomerase-like protein